MDLRIDFEGLDRFVRRFDDGPEIVGEELVTMVDRLAIVGEAEGKRNATRDAYDTGHYRRSIAKGRARRVGRGAESEFGSNVPYAEVIEKGRRAGKPMPPKGVLLPWMRRHGIPARAEFALRRKIGRDGIPAKEPLKKALAVVERRSRAEKQRTRDRIAARLVGR